MGLTDRIAERFGYVDSATSGKIAADMAADMFETKMSEWNDVILRAFDYDAGDADNIREPYKQHVWIYKCIRKRAESIAGLGGKLYARGKDGREVTSGPIHDLLMRPNPLMNGHELLEGISTWIDMQGEAFMVPVASKGQELGLTKYPAELYLLPPQYVQPDFDHDKRLLGWVFNHKDYFPADIVTHWKEFNPYDIHRGFSKLTLARISANQDHKANIYNEAFFDNNGVPGLTVTTDQQLKDAQFKQVEQQLKSAHQGARLAHSIMLLHSGFKRDHGGISQRDMDYIEQKKMNREEILALYTVPKALVSLEDKSGSLGREGTEPQKRIFWQEGMYPHGELIKRTMNEGFIWHYDSGIEWRPNWDQVEELQEAFSNRLDAGEKLIKQGYTADEVNEKLDYGMPVDKNWRRSWWVNAAVMAPAETVMDVGGGNPKSDNQGDEKIEPPPTTAAKMVKTLSPSAKNRRRRMIRELRRPVEKKFTDLLKPFFYSLRRDVLAAAGAQFGKAMKASVLAGIDWDEVTEGLVVKSKPAHAAAIDAGIEAAESILGASELTAESPVIKSLLNERMLEMKGITQTVRDQIDDQITASLTGGETAVQMADRIRNTFNVAEGRAKVIARTEATAGMNAAQMEIIQAAEIEKKQWSTVGDDLVRESHAAMEGEIVGIKDVFSNGLSFPGEAGGDPAEVINCRCDVLPVI